MKQPSMSVIDDEYDQFGDDISVSSKGHGQDNTNVEEERLAVTMENISDDMNLDGEEEEDIFMDDTFSLDTSIFGDLQPPQLPADWEPKVRKLYNVTRGCPSQYKHVDNPGYWHSYSFLPRYESRKKFKIHWAFPTHWSNTSCCHYVQDLSLIHI